MLNVKYIIKPSSEIQVSVTDKKNLNDSSTQIL